MRHVTPPGEAAARIAPETMAAPRLTFWGVRGSFPVPGAHVARYGGNTPCVEVGLGGDRIIIDAGTGLIPLGREMLAGGGSEPVHILLTHLHHDHVGALPFFKPVFQKDREIHLWCGNLDGETAEAALERLFSPPLFPIRLEDLSARIVHHGFRAGETLSVAGHAVRTAPLRHPSGATGYRFDFGKGSLAVVTDIEHEGDGQAPDPAVLALCAGVDSIVYDMMMDEHQFPACRGWGHSTPRAGARLAELAGARRLIGFHHGPTDDDDAMDAREAALQALFASSLMAREGLALVAAPSAR